MRGIRRYLDEFSREKRCEWIERVDERSKAQKQMYIRVNPEHNTICL